MPTEEQTQKDRDDCKVAFEKWKKTPTCQNMLMVIPETSLNIAFHWGYMAACSNKDNVFAVMVGPSKRSRTKKGK